MGEAPKFTPEEAAKTRPDLGEMLSKPKKQVPASEGSGGIDLKKYEKMAGKHKSIELDWNALNATRKKTASEVLGGRKPPKLRAEDRGQIAQLQGDVVSGVKVAKKMSLYKEMSGNLPMGSLELDKGRIRTALEQTERRERAGAKPPEFTAEDHEKIIRLSRDIVAGVERDKKLRAVKVVGYGDKNQMPFKDEVAEVEILEVEDEATPPVDIKDARLSALAEVTPPPHTFWGKILDKGKQLFNPELRDIRANQKFAALTSELATPTKKAESLDSRDFTNAMKEGEVYAKKVQQQEKAIEKEVAGPGQEIGRKNMEKLSEALEQLEKKIEELQPIVESIKLGWFTNLKTIKKKGPDYGKITNLPEGDENITLSYLAKEKEKFIAKGKTSEADKIAEQMRVLPEYTDTLVQLEKLKIESGQDLNDK